MPHGLHMMCRMTIWGHLNLMQTLRKNLKKHIPNVKSSRPLSTARDDDEIYTILKRSSLGDPTDERHSVRN